MADLDKKLIDDIMAGASRSIAELVANAFDEGFRAGRAQAVEHIGNAVAQLANEDMFATLADTKFGSSSTARESSQPAGTAAGRAAPGSVQAAVREILTDSKDAIGPNGIVDLAKARGLDLRESSVRMALQTLRDRGVAEQVRRGRWKLIPSWQMTPQAQAVDTAETTSSEAERPSAPADYWPLPGSG